MIFELDLYAWPSFMFARRNTGHFSPWDGELMQICDFRVIASAHPWIDVGRAAIDRDASESQVTTSPLTVEADGDGQFFTDVESLAWINRWDMDRFEFDGSDLFDLADIVDVVLFRLPIGEAHVSPCEVTL